MTAKPSFYGMAVVLGLMSAVGPFAIDMYLPAMLAIGRDLGTTMENVQATLWVFFISFGAGQLFYGPLSDMFGRKAPFYAGTGLFTLASIGCALTSDVQWLIGLRLLQGFGAAAGGAIPRAVVRDLYIGSEATRLMSLLMLVFSVCPILAPLAGSGLIALGSWRDVFWAVALLAVTAMALVAFALPETRPVSERLQGSLAAAGRGYRKLLRDSGFMGLVSISTLSISGFFLYLATSPFILVSHYGLSPVQFSLAFALNAAAFFGAAQLNGTLSRRFGLKALVRVGAVGAFAVLWLLLTYYLLVARGWVGDHFAILIGLVFCSNAFGGLVVPNCAVLALDRHGPIAGTASALMGTLQMVGGAVAMALIGPFNNGAPLPLAIAVSITSSLTLALTIATLSWGGAQRRHS